MLVITPGADYYNLLERHIKKHLPKLICLTAVASQYTIILDIARAVHQIDSAINIIIGGHHASLNPSEVLIEDCFDAVCIGEGERAVVEYASQIKSGNSKFISLDTAAIICFKCTVLSAPTTTWLISL